MFHSTKPIAPRFLKNWKFGEDGSLIYVPMLATAKSAFVALVEK